MPAYSIEKHMMKPVIDVRCNACKTHKNDHADTLSFTIFWFQRGKYESETILL